MNASFPSLLLLLLWGIPLVAQESLPESADQPEAPSDSDFEALRKTSPFTRVLNLSETYALRGVARINGEQVATLYNRETKKTVVVTPDVNNETGIALVGVSRAPKLDEVTAKISFAGDEAELKYEMTQLYPEPKAAPGATASHGGKPPEGERRGPSPQDIERFKALPEEKQAKLREYIGAVMKNYPDMSREERGNLIRGAMMRLTDGRDIEIPQGPAGGQAPSGGNPQGQPSQNSPGNREGRSENREGGERRERGDRR